MGLGRSDSPRNISTIFKTITIRGSFWTLLVLMLFSGQLLAQFETLTVGDKVISADSLGYVKLLYDQKPDSVRLGEFVIDAQKTKRYRVTIGWLHYQAYLNCHYTIRDSVIISLGNISEVRLVFERMLTPDLQAYQYQKAEFWGLAGLGALGLATETGRKYSLPLLGVGVLQNIFWRRSSAKKIDFCNGKKLTSLYDQGTWGMMVGVQSLARYNSRYTYNDKYSQSFVLPTVTIILNYEIDLDAGAKGDSEANGDYGLQFMGYKELSPKMVTRIGLNVFPNFSIGATLSDSIDFFNFFERNEQAQAKKALLLIAEANLDYILIDGVNKKVALTFGAFASNRVSEEIVFELDAPISVTSQGLKAILPVDMSFNSFGIKVGINYQYFLSDKIGMYFNAEAGALNLLSITTPIEKTNVVGGQLSFSSGLFLHR